jgi:hypothetical protein
MWSLLETATKEPLLDQTEEPRQNGSNNFSYVLVCNFSSNELNHLNPTCMMCATDLSERSHMENLPVTVVRNFGCTPWQDMKSAKFLEVLPVARSTLTKARTMFAMLESRSCHDQVLNQTFLYEMIYGGPSRVKIRAPMGSPNNFHFSIRRCGLFWLWREWTTFVSILRQLDSRSLVCFTNWIGYLFIMSFVQSQDSFRPIVSGSKSSFLAFPKLDIFDIQRFFTCVIQIQCSMHLYLSLKHEIGNEVKRPSETAMLGLW